MNYEMVIGLEVHVELATKSKIFCSCTTQFGGEPNTHVCPVCTGMPGSLPVLNEQVLEFAIRAGLALNCEITKYSKFDRKNYFYPDSPKAYQISQLYKPICRNGYLQIQVGGETKKIGITEMHMEEDAGKLIHDPLEDCTLIDYNRCGVPLIEIVSNPDFRSAEEVIAYLEKLREILMYLEISDCKLQEGSMRSDINLSVKPVGSSEFGTRTEMKNMNSFKAIHRAIQFESSRQIEILEEGGKVIQQTRRWDDDKTESFPMRSKEDAQDYRYFPEPDLLPMEISLRLIETIRKNLPELAEKKRKRYIEDFNLTAYDAEILTTEKNLSYLFEETNSICNNPKECSNLIIGEIMHLMKETNTLAENLSFSPDKLAYIINAMTAGAINRNVGKTLIEEVFKNDADPELYINKHGLAMLNDDKLIYNAVEEVLKNNDKSIKDYKAGKEKAFDFLVGQTMKILKGKGNPHTVNTMLKEKLLEV